MATHRAQGRRVVYVEGDAIVAAQGSWRERLPLAEIPLTRGGTHRLPGGERAWPPSARPGALGLDWDAMRRGLASFVNDADTAPGRFNVMDYRGATVIADYGHNPDAMRALVRAVEAMPAQAPLGGHQRRRRPPRRGHPRADRRSSARPSTT